MPHAGDDLASADEVKVYKDEGDEEQRSSENLSEDKIGLVTETEEVLFSQSKLCKPVGWLEIAYAIASNYDLRE